jgi:deazaflavin-dependent oxidoreductase (nitroreductase family)
MSLLGTVLKVHDEVYKRSDGRVGHRLLGVPSLMLTTTGRRSGEPRKTTLSYAKDGDRYLVVASKGGAPEPPAWLHNVRATPSVEVQVGRDRKPATATIVEQGDPDYDRLWRAVNDNNSGRYDAYQRKTTRPIPVVVLTPDA